MPFNPNEPQNGEIVDADLLRAQLNALNDKIPAIGSVTGLVKADGAGHLAAAVAGTDYLAPDPTAIDLPNRRLIAPAGDYQATGFDLTGINGIYDEVSPGTGYTRQWRNRNGLSWLSQCPSTVVFITDVPDVADPTNYHGLYISHDGVTGPYQNYDAPMASLPGTVAALAGGVGIVATWNDGTLRDGTGQPYLKANPAVTGTYPVQNDGVTPGQLASITITNGLITGVSVLP